MNLKANIFSIIDNLIKSHTDIVILIGGPGSTGKSTFAFEITNHIKKIFFKSVSIIDLDCYIKDRSIRYAQTPILSGHNPAAYNLLDAVNDVIAILKQKSISVKKYNRSLGIKGEGVTIQPSEILIIEGSMAFSPPILPFATFKIHLDADEITLYKNKLKKELAFGIMKDQVDRLFPILLKDYKEFIMPNVGLADVQISIDTNYFFTAMRFVSKAGNDLKPITVQTI